MASSSEKRAEGRGVAMAAAFFGILIVIVVGGAMALGAWSSSALPDNPS